MRKVDQVRASELAGDGIGGWGCCRYTGYRAEKSAYRCCEAGFWREWLGMRDCFSKNGRKGASKDV
jgi:hypothetical protein